MDEHDGGVTRTVSTAALDAETTFEDRQRQEEPYGDTERLWEPRPDRDRRGQELAQLQPLEDEPVPSVVQIAGHPLHPVVVPLPIGMFVGALVADLVYTRTHDRFWARAAHSMAAAGVGTGLLAGALGATDLVGRDRIRSLAVFGHPERRVPGLGPDPLHHGVAIKRQLGGVVHPYPFRVGALRGAGPEAQRAGKRRCGKCGRFH